MTTITNDPSLAIWIIIVVLLIVVVLVALDALIGAYLKSRKRKKMNPQLKYALIILLLFFTVFVLYALGIIRIPVEWFQ